MTEPTPPTAEPTPPTAEPAPPAPQATPPAPATAWTAPEPTPGPAPGVEFADWRRLVGYIIDIVINFVIVLVLAVIGVLLAVTLPILAVVPFLAVIIIPLIYFPYFWSREGPSNGQTPGMKQMGIRVVRDTDGGPTRSVRRSCG